MTTNQRTSTNKTKSTFKTTYLFFMIILLIGVFIGTISFCFMNNSEIKNLTFITELFIKNKGQLTFLESLSNTFMSSAILMLICFLLGFSAISQPVEVIIPVFKGIGLGVSISYIYILYGAKGFVISLLLIVPNAVLSSFAIIIAARESIKMSNFYTIFTLNKENIIDMKSNIKLYVLKYVILFVIIGVSSIIDSILSLLFAKILL